MTENKEIIDLRELVKKMWAKRRLFLIWLPIVAVVSYLLILCVPRYYIADTKLAPEVENQTTGGALSSIASSFGIDLSTMQSTDAISPILYPDLMDDNGFVVGLFSVEVEKADGALKTNYYDYLLRHRKYPWWEVAREWVKRQFISQETLKNGKSKTDPYHLSKIDNSLCYLIRQNIVLNVDKKYGTISIVVKDQDPLICKTLADSVSAHLQAYITRYRTNKARLDLEYYKKLTTEAKHEYERARQLYGSYSDANTDVVLESFRAKQNDMENDMQLKYNTYSTMNNQLQAAQAKVQARTPAFTPLKTAAVPIKPAGPKRMLFALGMTFMAAVIISLYITKDELAGKGK